MPELYFNAAARFFRSLALVCLFTGAGMADDLDNIVFEGVVTDSSGSVIIAAKITIKEKATLIERSAGTDDRGRYRIRFGEPGTYDIQVSARDFQEQERKAVTISGGRKLILNFVLSPLSINEQVSVTSANRSLIDTSRTVVGETLEGRELGGLPILNRNLLQLIFLLGGASEAPLATADLAEEGRGQFVRNAPEESGIFSLTGAPATSNNLTIDGLDNNDDRGARERITLPPEAIAEVQVITNQYAAEYGRASGGRVNLRTRGGANRYRGEAYLYFGDESLNANTYFRNARGLKRVPQSEYREGGTISGPLVKEKSFFFVSFERLEITDFAEINTLVPTRLNPLFPLPLPNRPTPEGSNVGLLFEEISTPESQNTGNSRADFHFTQSHNVALRFDISQGANRRGFAGGSRLADTILSAGRDSQSFSFTDNLILSPRWLNQFRLQLSRLLPRSKTASDSIGVVINEPERIIAGSFTGSNSSPAFARQENRLQIQDGISLSAATHFLKAGFDLQRVGSEFHNLFATGGQYAFASTEDFLVNRAERFIQRFATQSRAVNEVIGLYIQDEWKLKPDFTLSMGFRWDNETILRDRDNFSPRLAIAWDPFARQASGSGASGKSLLRAGFGIFYNRALLRTLDDFSLGKSSLTIDSDITPELLMLVKFPNPIQDGTLVERFALPETEFLRRLSANLEIPYTLQTGLGFERQLSKNLVAKADYIFTRGAHLWREANINAPQVPLGYGNLTEYLLSRDFDNRLFAGVRPIIGANADIVRFDLGSGTSTSAGAIRVSNGVRMISLGLNAPRSGNLSAALKALRPLRPDPSLNQVELLESTGNSFYHGGIFALNYLLNRQAQFRASYTLAKFIDEGTTNTASPQDLRDRRGERSLSLQDQRHRFVFSGLFQLPRLRLELAPIFSIGSSRPFNIGAGFDRNLNDIENDRPNLVNSLPRPVWRKPGDRDADEVKNALVLAPLGSSGNLPRNYGRGPGTFSFNLRVSRRFSLSERLGLRSSIDLFNVLNRTTYSFGSEFIDRDDADFLVPRRTQRPRTVHLGLKVDL
jgi:hypothetical protein